MRIYCKESVLSSGGKQLCEDRILITPNLAVVIDGATQVVPNAPLPSSSEGTWIADLTVQTLVELQHSHLNLHSILQLLSQKIDSELNTLKWPVERVPPVCSIGALRVTEDYLEVKILGDVSIIYKDKGQVTRIFNNKFLLNERAAFADVITTEQSKNEQLKGIISRRNGYINGLDGAGVLSRNQTSIEAAVHTQINPSPGDLLLLATDGFMRLVDVYGLVSTIEDLLTHAIRPGGLGNLLNLLRSFESDTSDYAGMHKRSDDAAAVVIEVIE